MRSVTVSPSYSVYVRVILTVVVRHPATVKFVPVLLGTAHVLRTVLVVDRKRGGVKVKN